MKAPEIPPGRPGRLAITLWDFCWYTQAGPGEPFADLEAVFVDTVARGYNAIRICAAPLYLFGDLDLPDDLTISGLGPTRKGGHFGERTRWYNVLGTHVIDLRERLQKLLTLAERDGCVVVLSSWEFQQSTSFAGTSGCTTDTPSTGRACAANEKPESSRAPTGRSTVESPLIFGEGWIGAWQQKMARVLLG